jgi:membrane associated rhomboid family serine protease
VTVGASGAIFGLFAAAFVIARGRGFDQLARDLGIILLINLALTFGIAGISIGGHLGGLTAGLICALLIVAGERGRLGPRRLPAELIAITIVGVLSIAGALAVA